MEQKDYNMEVLSVLIGGKSHIREIAKKLDTNPMMVSRRLKELLDKNAVDFKREGRNQVYFIKDSPEAMAFVIMAEQYKLMKIIENPEIRKIVRELLKNKKIKLAILFGSYAKNLSHERSDIDIYIETNDLKIKKEVESINSRVSVKIGKFNKDNVLIKEIIDNHIIIKGVERYYELKS